MIILKKTRESLVKRKPPLISSGAREHDIENIPFHFAIFWAAFIVQNLSNMSGNGDQETTALTCLVVIYAGIRTLYSLCYVFALQPWRTVFFILSQLTVATTSCVLIASAFQVDTSKILPATP